MLFQSAGFFIFDDRTPNHQQMKRTILLMLIPVFSLTGFVSFAQNDTITIVKKKYLIDGNLQTPKQLLILMQDHPEAFTSMKRAKSNFDGAMALSYIGGFFIGYPLGQAIAGGDPAWAMAGIGAGAVLLAIPLINGYHKHAQKAIRLYNKDMLRKKKGDIVLKFGTTPHGAGILIRF